MTQPPVPKAEYRYWACDLRTGEKVAQLPLKASQLPERIGDISTTSFSCDMSAVWEVGGDFIGTTTPGRTVIIAEREYEGDNTSDILWAGIVLPRETGSDPEAQLNCATIPVYLNRRFPVSHTYVSGPGDTDGQIITDLLADAADEGINLILDVDCPTLRTWRVLEKEHRSILACLKDLSDMEGGPEWTVVTRWKDANRLAIEFVFLARTRLGWAGAPNVRLDYPGSVRRYTKHEDFTEGHGSNHIKALNSNGAGSEPSRDEEALAQGWPRWEENVSTSGDLNATGLAGVAKSTLEKRARGQVTVDLSLDMTRGPQYGRDWVLGDNAQFFVAAPEPGEQPPSFAHPEGHSEVIRVIGVSIDPTNDTITPMLWSPYDEDSA